MNREDFDEIFNTPVLVKCRCGELAEITGITFRYADRIPEEQTKYYIKCDNCGLDTIILRQNGRFDPEDVAKRWEVLMGAIERVQNKKKAE